MLYLSKEQFLQHFGKSALNKQSAVYLHSHVALRPLGTKNAITIFSQILSIASLKCSQPCPETWAET